MTEEDAYNIALQELQTQQVSQGIWVKAIAFSEGDEKKAKANYLKFRAEQLLKAERGYAITTTGVRIASILFSPYGKISRSIFTILTICCAFSFKLGTDSGNDALAIVIFIIGGWILLCAHIKRARDAGFSPYMIFIYLIPFMGLLFLLVYISAPSENEKSKETDHENGAQAMQPASRHEDKIT